MLAGQEGCHVGSPNIQAQVRSALADLSAGDATAVDRLTPLLYAELRALAGSFLKRERADHSLQPTALVHEAWLRLAGQPDGAWTDAAHFKAVAAQVMRRVLVDHARRRASDKRGGDLHRVTLSGAAAEGTPEIADVLALDQALNRLAALHERQARVAELRFLAGLSVEETALVLGVDPRTVKSDWATARIFLAQELGHSSR